MRGLSRRMLAVPLVAVLFISHAPSARPEEKQKIPPKSRVGLSGLVERAEVRFVTLDLIVEEHVKGGWRRARDLTRERVHVRVGGGEVVLDSFENWCRDGADTRPPADGSTVAADRADIGAKPTPAGSASLPPPSQKYVLYFDLAHLTVGSRNRSFKAAMEWARTTARPEDEVMIVTGGRSVRIVRPLLPASHHLLEDLQSALEDFSSEDHWAQGEKGRIEEIMAQPSPDAKLALAKVYADIEHDLTRRALENLRDLMAIFGTVEGTKNLLFFSETLRMVPGIEYLALFGDATRLRAGFSLDGVGAIPNVASTLGQIAKQANEKNVRFYTVQAAGLGGALEDTMTMLASETGGMSVHGTSKLTTLFDRAHEDTSCFYRIGFRMPSEYDGKTRRITIRIGRDGIGYRVRYRRTLADPTKEQQEEDRLRAAFLVPDTARAFPLSLSFTRLFDHPGGSRIRIEVEIPLKGLLALPGPTPGARRVTVLVGGLVVPLRTEAAPLELSSRNPWVDVDPTRESLGFDRRVELNLPPGSGGSARSRVVYAGEIDAPPGAYRIITVSEDALAGTLSAWTTDFQARASHAVLGEIGLATEDPDAIVVSEPERPGVEIPAGSKKPELRSTALSLPPKMITTNRVLLNRNHPLSLFYALCSPVPDPAAARSLAGVLQRTLSCGEGGSLPLPSKPLPDVAGPGRCTLVIDSLSGDPAPSGPCRIEVQLKRPDADPETRRLDFQAGP